MPPAALPTNGERAVGTDPGQEISTRGKETRTEPGPNPGAVVSKCHDLGQLTNLPVSVVSPVKPR